MEAKPKIWAVGGGKGGVGKSVISTLLAFWLARKGKQTVLVDTDLGGANLHTLMGIKTPARTINDFVTKKYATLEEICLPTEWENLRLISGISANRDYRSLWGAMREQLERGGRLSESLLRAPMVTPAIAQAVATGEASGHMACPM